MSQTFLRRQDAAAYAREQGWAAFSIDLTPDKMWKPYYQRGENEADSLVAIFPDAFSHAEITWVGGATNDEDPHKVSVLVATCAYDDLEQYGDVREDRALARVWIKIHEDTIHLPEMLVEPVGGSRWDIFAPRVGHVMAGSEATPVKAKPTAATKPTKPVEATGDRVGKQYKEAVAKVWSTAESPVKRVWATADAMPGATRKEVVAACVEAGINKNTAGTQYHHWKVAQAAAAK